LTTSGKGRAKGWSVLLWSAALGAAFLCADAPCALAGSEIQPGATGPDSAFVSLRVETIPPGLLVLLDGVKVGRSPVGPLWLPAKRMRVQALPEDPRRFEPGRDGAVLTLARGRDTTVVLDLRPSVLVRSAPEPATLALLDPSAPGAETAAGQTPIRLLPSALARRSLRFDAAEHADTTLAGEALLRMADAGGGVATVQLRRVVPVHPPAAARGRPLLKRTWVRLSLIGLGAALTGSAAILRREGDRWYERYQLSSDPDQIPGYYDKTIHYDRLASAALGAGQVAITAGLFLLVVGSDR
jgi:hypothetical protein